MSGKRLSAAFLSAPLVGVFVCTITTWLIALPVVNSDGAFKADEGLQFLLAAFGVFGLPIAYVLTGVGLIFAKDIEHKGRVWAGAVVGVGALLGILGFALPMLFLFPWDPETPGEVALLLVPGLVGGASAGGCAWLILYRWPSRVA